MAKPTKTMAVNETELVGALAKRVQNAVGVSAENIETKQEVSLKRYNRAPLDGDEELSKRSKYQTPDIMERTDYNTAQSVKILDHSKQVVSFEPNGPEDADIADQMSDVCNFILRNKHSHVALLSPTIKNSFLTGLGVIMLEFRECVEESKPEMIKGATDDALVQFDAQEEAGEIIIEEVGEPYKAPPAAPDPNMPPEMAMIAEMMQPEVRDIKIRRIKKLPDLKLKNLPPEDFIVSKDADFNEQTGGIKAALQGHRSIQTRKSLIAQGFDKDTVKKIPRAEDKGEGIALQRAKETDYQQGIGDVEDDVTVYEIFTHIAIESDKARHYRITLAGDLESKPVLLDYVEVSKFYPYAAFVPYPIPNTLFGQNIIDRIGEEQRLRSQMTRAIHDGLNKSVHPIPIIDMETTNPDDVLNMHVGKPIRSSNPTGGLSFVNTPFTAMAASPIIDSLSQTMDYTTGVGGAVATASPSDMQNTTATASSIANSNQQTFIENICRHFADTSYRYMVKVIIDLLVDNPELAQPYIARLTNKPGEWKIDQWDPDMDVTANVAFGVTDKMANSANLQMILGLQQQLQGLGLANAHTLYLTATKIAENAGYKIPFFVDPSTLPPAPPPEPAPDPNAGLIEIEKVKAQLKAQTDEADRVFKAWEVRVEDDRERDRMAQEFELKRAEITAKYQAQVDIARVQQQQAAQRNDVDYAIAAQDAQVQQKAMQAEQMKAQQEAAQAQQAQAAQAQEPDPQTGAPAAPMPPQGV